MASQEPSVYVPLASGFQPVVVTPSVEAQIVTPVPSPTPSVRPTRPRRPPGHGLPKIVKHRTPKISHTLRGTASWYCNATHPEVRWSRCMAIHPDVAGIQPYVAIRSDLLYLRGKLVRICVGKAKCVWARVSDCNCGPHANLIDLYADVFAELGPLGRGTLPVTVSWRP